MVSLRDALTNMVSECFQACGYDRRYGVVTVSKRPDLGHYQCNGPLTAAKEYKTNPREIATAVVDRLKDASEFKDVSIAGPGFINFIIDDAYLADHVAGMAGERLGVPKIETPLSIIIDYGGANIAKPLHVGHLRAGIIGEALKRIARFIGHKVIGDVHLGDWGLQMGMVIGEIQRRLPDLPYFAESHAGPYPESAPVAPSKLDEIYPAASALCREDDEALEGARRITRELQEGRRGYRELWQKIHDVSVADLRDDYEKLNIEFDLWLGESDTQPRISSLIERLSNEGIAEYSQGALVIWVDLPDDKKELPPLLLLKSDGAALYGTTDLATIDQRMSDHNPDLILYIVDKRQSDHFQQVFRAARKADIAPESKTALEHVGFGTMNGSDGKPFKTRSGGVMKLKDLIEMLVSKALDRMEEAAVAQDYTAAQKDEIARVVGVAALKYGDLMNQPAKDYVFDLDKFASFEGKTGPYLLYTAVRIKSILRNVADGKLQAGPLIPPASDVERNLLLKIAAFPDQLTAAFSQRGPHLLCDYIYDLASGFSSFYRDHHILRESDSARQSSWITLAGLSLQAIELVTHLLGIELPERM